MFIAVSAWWVKWAFIATVGAFGDVLRGRILPVTALTASLAAGIAELTVLLLKGITDRERPPIAEPSIDPLILIPDSTSLPSGHAATAFAAATAVILVYPQLRAPLLLLAALVASSRAYLGVHYWSDVIAGCLVGVAIGWATVYLVGLVRVLRGRAQHRARSGTSSFRFRRSQG